MNRLLTRCRRPATVALSCAAALLLSFPAGAQSLGQAEVGPVVATPADKVTALEIERGLRQGIPVVDLPGRVEAPQPFALTCATPQTSGVIQATHPYYDVFLDSASGAFTARTGAMHSVTALAGGPQNVIYGGSGGSPGTSDVSWRFHTQGITYQNPGGGSACVFDPPDTPMEPNSIGIEQEFTVTPEPGVTCTLRQEIVAFGTTEADSGVRMTLGTTNWSSSTTLVAVGVRWQIDYQNTSDDGPWFATVTCDPPVVDAEWSTEHELRTSEIRDFYRIQNNTGFPIFSNVSSTTAIAGIPNTGTPDRLIYGRWGSFRASVWNFAPTEGACCPDSDSAVLWYHGYLPADADVLNPGESSRHSVVIFSSPDTVDCGSFVPTCASSIVSPPMNQTICIGGSASLDASGITLTDCAGAVDYTWTDGTSIWGFPSIVVSPVDTTTYNVAVTCSADPSCRVDYSATVTVDKPPQFLPPLAADPDACNNGIKLTWNPATFYGAAASGTYNVYRSEISCADAEASAPIARGLLVPGWFDGSTVGGRNYYYVVEAEDATPGTPCVPVGPAGGAITQLCASAINDTLDEAPPAGVGTVLFATKRGDEIRLSWITLRPLLPGEHPHLLKTTLDPRRRFTRVSVEGDMSPGYAETDTSAWLQFFDLRVANGCERESLPDYPPTFN